MLPNLIIVGTPKAGTTSIHQWLGDHPCAVGPTTKETGYFVDPDSHAFRADANFRDHGLAGYENYFPARLQDEPELVFESAPDYMFQSTALAAVPSLPSAPLIVFVLREPAAPIYSIFNYLQQNWRYVPADMTFATFIELAKDESSALGNHELLQHAIDNCRYVKHLERWRERCGDDRLRVYLFDDLVADNRAFMQRLCRDTGIDPAFYDNYAFPRENETYRVRSMTLQSINVALRKMLPRGQLYERLRALYRRANTRSGAPEKTAEVRRTLAQLREMYRDENARLAQRFRLDLSRW